MSGFSEILNTLAAPASDLLLRVNSTGAVLTGIRGGQEIRLATDPRTFQFVLVPTSVSNGIPANNATNFTSPDSANFSVTVPEPVMVALFGLGIGLAGAIRSRRRSS